MVDAKLFSEALPPNDKVFLFYHSTMESTARQVQQLHPDSVKLVDVRWGRFKDGFPDIQIDGDGLEEAKQGKAVCFLSNLSQPDLIFEQVSFIYALPKHRVGETRVIVPWFSTGTMERVENIGDVATAKSLARMLSGTPPSRTGPVSFTVYDIHALAEQFFFDDSVLVELKTAVFLLRQALLKLPDKDSVAIAYPDDGAYKRFKKYFSDYPAVICGKVRDANDPDKRVVQVKEGDANGRHCVIIDDLVQSGGTLIECAKGMQASGATGVSCWVTHAIFPQESWRKFTEGEGAALIHKFWITDSVPHVSSVLDGMAPFEVLSLAPLIGHLLTGHAVLAP